MNMTKKEILVVIGCDTDPDRSGLLDGVSEEELSWKGMLDGIPQLKNKLKNIRDSENSSPTISWCLRADYQIKRYYGSYNHILNKHNDFFLQLEQDGDELAWHPHFWNYDENQECWYQDCYDREWQVRMLKEAHAAYIQSLPGRAKSVRMGWDYHNNETFASLEEIGVEVDFSGIPGLRIDPKNDKVRSANFFDWSLSPNHPYYPAISDYRREARDGEEAFRLLEAPNFVSESFFWGNVSGLVLAKKMKNPMQILRALKRPTYWIGITGKPSYFNPLVAQIGRTLKKSRRIVFVTYFHPDELLPNKSSLYSLENMHENLSSLMRSAEKLGASIRFIRATDIKGMLIAVGG